MSTRTGSAMKAAAILGWTEDLPFPFRANYARPGKDRWQPLANAYVHTLYIRMGPSTAKRQGNNKPAPEPSCAPAGISF